MKHLPENHSAENITKCVSQILSRYGLLEEKYYAVTADGASAQQLGVGSIGEFEQAWVIWCIDHQLNLIVRESLQIVDKEMRKIKSIVSHFRRSCLSNEEMKSFNKGKGIKNRKLVLDVITRYISL